MNLKNYDNYLINNFSDLESVQINISFDKKLYEKLNKLVIKLNKKRIRKICYNRTELLILAIKLYILFLNENEDNICHIFDAVDS